jgi:hypothetical protein
VRHQPAIAVYTNPHDEVVIRQQDSSDDNFAFITKDNVLKVVERMLALAEVETDSCTALAARTAGTNATVTGSVTATVTRTVTA